MKRKVFALVEGMPMFEQKCWICGDPTHHTIYLDAKDRRGYPCCPEHAEGRVAA
jgi:hypothetical protein